MCRAHGSDDLIMLPRSAAAEAPATTLDASLLKRQQQPRPQQPQQQPCLMLSPPALYSNAASTAETKSHNGIGKLLVLAFLSGTHVGFGGLLAITVGGAIPGIAEENPGLQKFILGAIGLPFGLYMVVAAGGELFTSNVATLTAGVLEGSASAGALAKSWVLSYLGNFAGALALAYITSEARTVNVESATAIGQAKTSEDFLQAFLRGILCNWLVCMAVYMAAGAADAAGKFVCVFLPITLFVTIGADHCVANMYLISVAMMVGADISVYDFLIGSQLPVTLGNIVGGAVMVSGLYSLAYGTPARLLTTDWLAPWCQQHAAQRCHKVKTPLGATPTDEAGSAA